MRRKGVTRFLLWQEYKGDHPTGYQYSQFCERYSQWRGRQDPVTRQTHKAGVKLLGHRHVTTTQIYDKRRRTTKESASHYVPVYRSARWVKERDSIGKH